MATHNATRTAEIPALTLRATVVPSTIDVERRTVQVTWTTGARVMRGFWERYYEELSLNPEHVRMGRLQSGTAPLLNSHRSDDIADVIGVVESAELGAKSGTATVRFDSGVDGEEAFRKVREGILRNLSVGYRTWKLTKIEDGADKVPVYRAVDWEPYELSMTPLGADAGAVTRAAAANTNACEFTEEQKMGPEKEHSTIVPSSANDLASAERARVLGIQRVGRALHRPESEMDAAINNPGMTLEAFRAAAVDALAAAPASAGGVITFARRDPRIEPGADERDKWLLRSENWIIQRAGLGKAVSAAAEKAGQKIDLDPGESRGLTLVEMARECLARAGVRTSGMDPMHMIGLAFTHRGSGLNSSSDFPIILENVQNKTLLASYATTPDTWRRFCVIGSLTDFRPHNRYRQGSFGVLTKVNEGGEFQNASIPDGEKQTISGDTKGRIVAITRQTIINDDMGALTDIATRLGRAAALTIEVDVYGALLSNGGNGPIMGDGLPLFHANHTNIGTGAALTVASVDADRVLMGKQSDPAKNEFLELRPAILLLPLGLGGQARVINNAQYDTDKVANARNQEPNKVVGLYRDIVDTARLDGTTRYSFADPGIAPVFEVAFLNGVETPVMEMQNGWRIDGVEWKIRLDYGIGARDYRGVVRNAGA